MQSLSLTLSKRLSNNSNPLFRISPNLIPHASSSSDSSSPLTPNSPPVSAYSSAPNGGASASFALKNFLNAPWSTTQSRGVSVSGSDVKVENLIGNRGRAYEVLKQNRTHEGIRKSTAKVLPHSVAGYATAATMGDDITRTVRNSALRNVGPKTKREQLLKVTSAAPLLLLYPNAYSMLIANFFIFWHINAGVQEILADYVHHEMTLNFVYILFRLFLIIAMKDVFLQFVFV